MLQFFNIHLVTCMFTNTQNSTHWENLKKYLKKTSLRKECNGYVVPESNANVTKAMVIYKNVPQ